MVKLIIFVVVMLVLYFTFFNTYELIAYKKGSRWFDQVKRKERKNELQ